MSLLLSIAGVMISGVGVSATLLQRYNDLNKWEEKDLEVDGAWLEAAIEAGQLSGDPAGYAWPMEAHVPTMELKGTHSTVIAVNEEKRSKYRLVRGEPGHRHLLVKKLTEGK